MTAGAKAGWIGLGAVVVAAMLITGGWRTMMGTVMGAETTRKEPIPAPAVDERIPAQNMRRQCLRADVSGGYRRLFSGSRV